MNEKLKVYKKITSVIIIMQRQKQRQNSVDTEQNFLFKEKTNTIAASRRLVKKLVAIGFSHACRHRLKLDESLFVDRQCEDITVKASFSKKKRQFYSKLGPESLRG